uniref:Bifunctional inhibitor/plant lipid transfer protein/seed storage helical domain-containing protein n=1 Tax=Cajanus cajan TaxID=3821 RepID=A0A151S9T9_CAJCA|nr:hypothetical protein KK1_026623 [Cajanus cajan]KYP51597.1 hypothetical protein KK1_026625 [Cajanus cajan]
MDLQQRMLVMVIVTLMIGIDISNGLTICNVSVDNLLKCKPAATPPNPTPPSKECCDVLSHANLPCLCTYKNSPLLPLYGIDPDLAVQLPAKCNIPNPPKC